MSPLLWLCFVISGASALALEMLWMRSASLLLGQTAATTATVLAAYFGGLGFGAALARSIRRRPLRAYGFLELGAAAGAGWSFVVFRALSGDTAQSWLAAGGPAVALAAVGLATGPATICLGATLPALGQALAAPEGVAPGSAARCGGLLYALNTLGGAAGISAMGFGLPAVVGIRLSYGATGAASALAGAVALVVDRRQAAPDSRGRAASSVEAAVETAVEAAADARSSLAAPRGRLRAVAAGAGALGLALEVLWTRLFAQVLHNSVYSFSAIALVFLLAIAAGAALAALALRRVSPTSIAGGALIAAAVATVAGFWIFMEATNGLSYLGMRSGLGEYLARVVALAAATAGPAALAAGAVLPALWSAWGGRDPAARSLGDLSAANTLGGIVGALAAGFLAAPLLGLRGSMLAAATGYLVLADAIAPRPSRWRLLGYAALLAVVVANPMRAPIVHLLPGVETLRSIEEGASGIVSVVETEGDLQLRLDNYYILGGTSAAAGERRLGLVPLLLHPDPHRAAFIGLATGITAGAGPALRVEETTVIELVSEVARAARTHFASWNGRLVDRPEVRVVIDDGRRRLAASGERFDVIVSDLFIPWHAGTGSLYSREMYQTVAHRLSPGGLFCQWLPLYQLTREEFDVIARTFLGAFPQVGLWRADFYPSRPVLGLVGSLAPRAVDLDRVAERARGLPEGCRDPLLATARGFAMLYAGDLAAAADLFGPGPINTDDRPVIEFLAPRLTRISSDGDKDWFTGAPLASFYQELDRRLDGVPDPHLPATQAIRDARRAGTALFACALAMTRKETGTAARLEAEVRSLVPEVIVAAEPIDPAASQAEARRRLRAIEVEQEEVGQKLEAMERRLKELGEGKGKP